jgi:cystathionine beta-lyase
MKYDFESTIDRRGHDAIAVEAIGSPDFAGFAPLKPSEDFETIPMWIADMNFPTADSIREAIIERANHPLFGYFTPSDEYYNAIKYWHKLRKGVTDLSNAVISYENGVLGGVISAIKVFASPGDPILVHSPTYMGFTEALKSNGYMIVHSPLKQDKDGIWRMDYEDMDRKLKENKIHVAIFCNPHNPTGRVWTKEEIEKAAEVYKDNGCWVVSDEIWSDLIMEGYKYTPFQSVNDWAKMNTSAFYAPSKTFNLAGLIGAYSVIYNDYVRDRVKKISSKLFYNSMNVLSQHALIGAYSEEGNEWLNQLLPILTKNIRLTNDKITSNFRGVVGSKTEGTYMVFMECSDWLKANSKSQQELLKRGWDYGIGWQDGNLFEGPTSIRLNLASPTERIKEALDRMDRYVFNAKWD